MADEVVISVDDEGTLEFVYSDELADVMDLGDVAVCRASHVEPHPTKTGWLADMAPSGGPVIGLTSVALRPHKDCDCDDCDKVVVALDPFKTRAEALKAERVWLTANKGL
jgi:hypothetical protein